MRCGGLSVRTPSPAGLTARLLGGLLISALISGCGTTAKEVRHHPYQARLERVLATVLPHTKYPERHYWIRVSEPMEHPVGLAVMPQRHIYLSESLIDQADEATLRALVVHGVAHHRLHHHGKRNILAFLQRIAFKIGGFFVPGLSYGHHLGGPLTEVPLSAGQERGADAKTATYLTRMGYPAQDWLRAMEFLVEHDYPEHVGRITTRGRGFTNRIGRLRTLEQQAQPGN